MRITDIRIRNFLGLRQLDLAITSAIALLVGPNGAGKSSTRDGIALALIGELSRGIGAKKDAAQLIRAGSDSAACEVVTADGDQHQVTITKTKLVARLGRDGADPVLPFVLDAQSFARLEVKERRTFLFDLMGVKTEPADLQARLTARLFAGRTPTAAEAARVARIVPLLRGGFDGAAQEARTQATTSKGAWRGVTSENWGSDKAKTWAATVPPHDPAIAADLATKLKHCDAALESWQQQVGALEAEEKRRGALRTEAVAAKTLADFEQRRRDKVAADTQTLQDAQATLAAAAEAAGETKRVGMVHDLARAMHTLLADFFDDDLSAHESGSVRSAHAALQVYIATHGAFGGGAGDAEAAGRVPALRQAVEMSTRALTNAQRDLDQSLNAKATHERITEELAETFDAAGLADAREQVEKLKAERTSMQAKAEEQRSIRALVEGAEAKTAAAAGHHEAVVGWDAIAEALGPTGIPADLLADAMGPMNARLAQSAADSGWQPVVLSPDMAITSGGREYRLLSESERWRVDAVLAEAIAHLSGARLLLLDRFDVLDLAGRAALLSWLDTLAETGEVDTVLLFGTLKALPTSLPPTMEAHWIQDGACSASTVQAEPEAAAA